MDRGVKFLNRVGQANHDLHNEGILFSDAIGVSTLVCLLNNGDNGATESAAALLGPFWRMGAPDTPNGGSIVRSPTGGPELFASCRITDPAGAPLPGVTVDIWHSAPTGFYENQDPTQAPMNLRGVFRTDADGRFAFRSTKPAGYPVPTDGPVGDLLRAQSRHPFRPAHLHILAYTPGYKTLITQVFVDDDENLDSDVAFGVTQPLIGNYVRHEAGERPTSAENLGRHRLIDKLHVADLLGWADILGNAVKDVAAGAHLFRSGDFEALRHAAMAGMGIALLPSWVVGPDVEIGALERLAIAGEAWNGRTAGIYVLRAPVKLSAKLKVFVAALRSRIGSPSVWDEGLLTPPPTNITLEV